MGLTKKFFEIDFENLSSKNASKMHFGSSKLLVSIAKNVPLNQKMETWFETSIGAISASF